MSCNYGYPLILGAIGRPCPVIVALHSSSWCHWPAMSCDYDSPLIVLVPLAHYVLWLWLSTHYLGAIGRLCPVIVALYALSWCYWPTMSCDYGYPLILLVPLADYVLWLWLSTHYLGAIGRLCPVIMAIHSSSWCHWPTMSCDCGSLLIILVPLADYVLWLWLSTHPLGAIGWLCPVIVALYSLSWCHWPTMSCDCGYPLILLVPLADYVLWLWLSTHPLGAIGRLCPVIVAIHSSSWCHWPTMSCNYGYPLILLVPLADYVLWLWLSTHYLGAIGRLCHVIVALHSSSWCHWPAMSCDYESSLIILVPLADYVLWLWLSTHPLGAIGRLCPVIVAIHSLSWCHWPIMSCDCGSLLIILVLLADYVLWLWLSTHPLGAIGRLCPVIVALYSLSWCYWPTMSCDCGSLLIILVLLADYVLWLWLSTHPLGAIGRLCPVIVAIHSLSWCHWPTMSCDCGSTHYLGAIGRLCPVIMAIHSSSWCHWPTMSCDCGSLLIILVPLADYVLWLWFSTHYLGAIGRLCPVIMAIHSLSWCHWPTMSCDCGSLLIILVPLVDYVMWLWFSIHPLGAMGRQCPVIMTLHSLSWCHWPTMSCGCGSSLIFFVPLTGCVL